MITARTIRRVAIQFITLTLIYMVVTPTVPAEEQEEGQKLYVEYQCYQCHGYEGQGGTPGGPRIALLGYSFEAFAARARHTNVMPAYSPNVLSDEDMKIIYDYMESLPEPPPVEDIPILRDALEKLE